MSIVITAGQRGDSPQFEPVLEAIRVPRLELGRPRSRPDRVWADKAYDSHSNAPTRADAGSEPPSRFRRTGSATASSAARAADGRRSSTPSPALAWHRPLHTPGTSGRRQALHRHRGPGVMLRPRLGLCPRGPRPVPHLGVRPPHRHAHPADPAVVPATVARHGVDGPAVHRDRGRPPRRGRAQAARVRHPHGRATGSPGEEARRDPRQERHLPGEDPGRGDRSRESRPRHRDGETEVGRHPLPPGHRPSGSARIVGRVAGLSGSSDPARRCGEMPRRILQAVSV